MNKLLLSAAAIVAFSTASASYAQTAAFDFTVGTGIVSGPAGVDGFSFTPSVDIYVTSLGYYDDAQDSLIDAHDVGIYDFATQDLIISTTIDGSSTLDGLFQYSDITPLLLTAGEVYVVAGFTPGPSSDLGTTPAVAGVTIGAEITLNDYLYDYAPALQFPTQAYGNGEYLWFGPNFKYDLDTDGDGVIDSQDDFPSDPTESTDTDGDGVGDNADEFPNDATETTDTDGDGVGDNADAFPNDATESADTDGDGVGDNTDPCPDDAADACAAGGCAYNTSGSYDMLLMILLACGLFYSRNAWLARK